MSEFEDKKKEFVRDLVCLVASLAFGLYLIATQSGEYYNLDDHAIMIIVGIFFLGFVDAVNMLLRMGLMLLDWVMKINPQISQIGTDGEESE